MTKAPTRRPRTREPTAPKADHQLADAKTMAAPPIAAGAELLLTTAPADATCRAKPPGKATQIAALMLHDEGPTLAEMVTATGWLPHTTRAALTGLKKKGYAISSDKADDVRTTARLRRRVLSV